MFTLRLTTTDDRKELVLNVNDSIRETLANQDISTANTVVHIAGSLVTDMDSTFAQYGVAEDTTVSMTAIVKANGAA